jgi:two-component system LytT family response regulator
MINCIIIDDEQHAIDLLTHHIRKTPFLNLVYATTDPIEGLELLNQQKIDLIFLDVQMPDMTGIDLIKAISGKSKVILTTAYSEYAMEGFENEVVDYLLKPISFARFIKGAQRALSMITPTLAAPPPDDNDYIFVKTEQKGKLLRVKLNDIVYVEGLKNYVTIVTRQEQKVVALLNIRDLEERLPAGSFIRTHKSFILATAYIRMIEGNTVHLEHTTQTVPIGDTYREAFMTQMKDKIMTNRK